MPERMSLQQVIHICLKTKYMFPVTGNFAARVGVSVKLIFAHNIGFCVISTTYYSTRNSDVGEGCLSFLHSAFYFFCSSAVATITLCKINFII